MTPAQVYSWIFYATAMASGLSPAKWAEVSMLADGINHSVPTHSEMQEAIAFCVASGLIRKQQKKLELTSEGLELLASGKEGAKTAKAVWKRLEAHFERLL